LPINLPHEPRVDVVLIGAADDQYSRGLARIPTVLQQRQQAVGGERSG